VALNLGAYKVGEFSGILEEALMEEDAEAPHGQLLHQFNVLLAEAIHSLEIIIDRYDPQAAPGQ
jgi:hypothetical protein